jgi:exonuclease III
LDIKEYATNLNIEINMRGTAILAKNEIHITHIKKLPSERAIAAEFIDKQLINIYAPSGTAQRTESEYVLSRELPALFWTIS